MKLKILIAYTMEHLGIDIKELKRRKSKAVVIVYDKEEAAGFTSQRVVATSLTKMMS